MRSLANWLIVIFMTMYWIFRIIVAYMAAMGRTFIVRPIDYRVEIVLLFITFVCIVLVMKRKKVGGFIYLTSYLLYFGVDLFNQVMPVIKNGSFDLDIGMDMFTSIIAVILAIITLMDVLADNVKTTDDKKTSWFYDNKETDRKLDDRADKNNYRIM